MAETKPEVIDKGSTLVNPDTGERRAVELGSLGEQESLSSGFQAETQAPAAKATYVLPDGTRKAAVSGSDEERQLFADGAKPEVNKYEPAPSLITPEEEKSGFGLDTFDKRKDEIGKEKKDEGAEPTTEPTDNEKQVNDMAGQINNIYTQQVAEYNNLLVKFDEYAGKMDGRNKAIIDDIRNAYTGKIKRQEQLNNAVLAGIRVRGITSGRARYASEMQANIMSNEQRAALDRIDALENERDAMIRQAESAAEDKDFALLNDRMAITEQIAEKELEALREVQASLAAEEKMQLDMMKEMREQDKFELEKDKFAMDRAKTIFDMGEAENKHFSTTLKNVSDLMSMGVMPENFSFDKQREFESKLGLEEGSFETFMTKFKEVSNDLADRFLSKDEAMSLGVSFGTTIKEVRGLGLVPRAVDSSGLSISDQLKVAKEGYRIDEAGQIYKGNERDPITGAATDPTKVFGEYNFTSYATDPNWGIAIRNNIAAIGEVETPEDLATYIASVNKNVNSQEVADDIWLSANTFGIEPEMLTAILKHESIMTTSNVAKNNNNPGGITWNNNFPESMKGTARPANEGGHYVKFPTMKDGIDMVSQNISRRRQEEAEPDKEIDAFTRLQASNLIRDSVGARNATDTELVASVAQLLSKGTTRDDIADMLRYSEQSLDYGEWRSVANSVFSAVPGVKRKAIEDGLDDYIEAGDVAGAHDYVLKVARDTATADEKKGVVGREEALYAIGVIEENLNKYVELGGDTGLISGNVEKFYQTVLRKTKDPMLAEIANTIAQTIQTYRQQLTGAAFTESEAREYNRLFPSIDKAPELNQAKISSLRSQYERNMRLFYERQLGKTGYNKLEDLTKQPILGLGDTGRFDNTSQADTSQADSQLSDEDAYAKYQELTGAMVPRSGGSGF